MGCLEKLGLAYPELTDIERKAILRNLGEVRNLNIETQGKLKSLISKKIEDLTPTDLKIKTDLLKKAEAKIRKLKKNDSRTESEIRRKVKEKIEDLREIQAVHLKDKANNFFKEHNLLKEILDPNFKGNAVEALLAPIEGTTRNIEKRVHTVENIAVSNNNRNRDLMLRDLRHRGLFNAAAKGDFDKAVAADMFNRGLNNYKPSDNPIVKGMADVYTKMNSGIIDMMQASGSTIRERRGYITRQTHDSVKIAEADFPKWGKDIYTKIDHEKSFGTTDKQEVIKKLRAIFDTIDESAFGPSGIARGKRKLVFKSGEDWFDYNAEYGTGTMLDGMLRSIDINSRNAAVISKYGNNPREMKDVIKGRVEKIFGGNNTVMGNLSKFDDAFEIMMGAHRRPAKTAPAKIVRGLNLYNTFRMGGRFGITAMNDFNNTLSVVTRATGSNPFMASIDFIQSSLESVTPSQRKAAASEMAISLGESLDELNSRLGISSKPGRISQAVDGFMVMNLLRPVTSFFRATNARTGRRMLGRMLDKDTAKLNRFEQSSLAMFDEQDIKNLRKIKSDDGVSHWEIEKAELDSGDIDPKKYKQKLMEKVGSYYTDIVNSGSPTPGFKEFRRTGKHLKPDSIERMMMDVTTQFKLTTLKTGSEAMTLARVSNTNSKAIGLNSVKNIATYTVSGMMIAYGIKAAVDISKGKEPLTWETMTTEDYLGLIATSGMGGIVADMLASVSNKGYGRSLGGDMSGPAWGTIEDIGSPILEMLKGDFDEKDFRRLKRLIPGQNWWVIPAFNNYVLQDIAERSGRGSF